MQNINTSLRARLLAVAGKLQEKINGGSSAKEIAREVVRHFAFRQHITHQPPNHTNNNSKIIHGDAWVAIYQEEDEDFIQVYKRSPPFRSKDEALSFLKEKWGGSVDESLEGLMLQRVVFEPELDEIPVEKSVGKVENSILNLLKHQFDHHPKFLGFPEGHHSLEAYHLQIQGYMNLQLDNLVGELNKPESAGLIGRNTDGEHAVVSESQWKKVHGSVPYPPKTIEKEKKIEMRLVPDTQIYTLLALEEFLFPMHGIDLVHALAKAHERSHESYSASKLRPSLDRSPDIGVFLGHDGFQDVVATMARRGFDFQPVFNDHKQCIGTLELKELMKYLQHNNFSSLPSTVDGNELTQRNLLSPAPPILDGTMSLHRANEIMYYGIGCVLVRYDKDRWKPDEQAYLDLHLEEGLHIFTRHDYVVSQC